MITNYMDLLPEEIIENIHKINEKEYHQNLIHEFTSICSEIKNRMADVFDDEDDDYYRETFDIEYFLAFNKHNKKKLGTNWIVNHEYDEDFGVINGFIAKIRAEYYFSLF
tara:strand:- start:2466 stop:2795 length:330 start_codon:yes stop_codon:yes gene_type:complete